MTKSKARPAAVEDSAVPPPAKRRKALPDARNDGLDDVLLNNNSYKKLAPAHTTKLSLPNTSKVNDERAVVNTPSAHTDVVRSRGQKGPVETIDISSDGSSDESSEEDEEEGSNDRITEQPSTNPETNGVAHEDRDEEGGSEDDEMVDGGQDEPAEEDEEEATFGERLAAQHAEPIDVEAALAQTNGGSLDQGSKPKFLIPTGATFSTVLTQALRTNDTMLLESCFETANLESVRNTLSRIDSTLVIALMSKIAEKIAKKPGRLGNLMVWIQWVIIAHGGYLAGQPNLVKQLAILQRVIKARADGLQPLLQLKGKLDMLSAQLDLRRDIQDRNARNEEDEEGAVTIYVEGEEDERLGGSNEESDDQDGEQRLLLKGFDGVEAAGFDEGEVEPGAFRHGIVKGDVEVSDESDAEEGLFDDEAEETDDDDGEDSESDDEVASDDEDSG